MKVYVHKYPINCDASTQQVYNYLKSRFSIHISESQSIKNTIVSRCKPVLQKLHATVCIVIGRPPQSIARVLIHSLLSIICCKYILRNGIICALFQPQVVQNATLVHQPGCVHIVGNEN